MSKKILLISGEGLGNFCQLLPLLRTLREVLGYDVDYCHLFGSYSLGDFKIPYINKQLSKDELSSVDLSEYEGKVSTIWTEGYINAMGLYKLPLLAKIYPMSMEVSEVDTYMNIARDLGAKEEELIWEAEYIPKHYFGKYDVILSNGYNKFGSARWEIKSYPYYIKLVELLKENGLTVASIGSREEYIEGTANETGRSLYTSLCLVRDARSVVCNDTGIYHFSNLVGTPNIPIFTATSIAKNYDSRFHRYASLMYRKDLACRPCQAGQRWRKDCDSWECRNIDPKLIIKKVMETIK